ncbi:DUF4177 domain-containing protein [Halogeometricum limi]|uniref:DUF4177 domain-containing protein n=1 Tax=Halogeometricum limi TaxID=555875 RepID=A0A1I6G3S2_9EURY|nr:DUF4177 domain-containing protein [Halogeometricum limi]SFR36829.1 protein of unknown function [Halogeometricum limi]
MVTDDRTERWEYEVIRPPRGETKKEAEDPKSVLNELAADGWRLVETVDYTGGGTKYFVFERPVRTGDDAPGEANGDTRADEEGEW